MVLVPGISDSEEDTPLEVPAPVEAVFIGLDDPVEEDLVTGDDPVEVPDPDEEDLALEEESCFEEDVD